MREESYCGEKKKKKNKTWIEKQYTPWLQKESELYTTYCQINTQRDTFYKRQSINLKLHSIQKNIEGFSIYFKNFHNVDSKSDQNRKYTHTHIYYVD